jgi:hypothetical protein
MSACIKTWSLDTKLAIKGISMKSAFSPKTCYWEQEQRPADIDASREKHFIKGNYQKKTGAIAEV